MIEKKRARKSVKAGRKAIPRVRKQAGEHVAAGELPARPVPLIADEGGYVRELMRRIVTECPRRQPTSEDEKRGSFIMKAEFDRLGLPTAVEEFEFNDNLYANIALHCGLSTLGTAVGGLLPPLGLLLHLLPAWSYRMESTRRRYVLRRLFPFKPSRNVLAVAPAETPEPALRIVLLAHIDAAFTGLLFNPVVVEKFAGPSLPKGFEWFGRSMQMTNRSQFALAGFDVLRMALGPLAWPLRPVEAALTVPSLVGFLLNLEVVVRNRIVPGANDDLSGVVALPVLAQRLAATKRREVELVFGVTGCEEASLGGGDALRRAREGVWDKSRTIVIGLDGLTNGQLRFLEIEGEVVRTRVPDWLCQAALSVARSEPRFSGVSGFEVPVGGSDIAAFLAHGWDGICLACVDPAIGSPRHYHQPSDTPENLDWDGLMDSIDFTERLVGEVVARRLGPA